MRSSARYLPAVLLTILGLATVLWAQTAPIQSDKTPRGSSSGRVTLKEKGAAGVVIVLRKGDYMNPYEHGPRATTDQDGYVARMPPRTVKREIMLQDGVTTDVTLTIDMSAPLPPPKP